MSASRRSTPIGGEDAINNLDKQSILLLRRYQVAAKRALRTTIPAITDRIVVRIPGHRPTYQDLSEIGTQKAPPPFTFPESGLYGQVARLDFDEHRGYPSSRPLVLREIEVAA